MNKKMILERWSNADYLNSIEGCIQSICSDRASIDGADLAGLSIGPDAVLSEFKNKSLYHSNISNSNLSYANISGGMSNSSFVNVIFIKSHLDRCILLECTVVNCDFSHSRLVAKMDDTVCENSNFTGAKFGAGSTGLEYGGRRVKFINCDFSGAVFNKVEFRASKFINCSFSGARFINCDLRGVKFDGEVMPSASQFEKMDVPTWAR